MNYLTGKHKFFDSPITSFNTDNGLIVISGRSIQMNANQFWRPLKARLKKHIENSKSITSIRFQMEYISSSSVEELVEFLKLSKNLTNKGNNFRVEWLYEKGDDDMLELGNSINDIVDLNMKYIQMN